MARTKKQKRATSFVTLRKQKLSKGRESYYLDIYKDGVRHYEFLKLYLVPVVDEATKVQNQNTKQAAEAIRSERELEVIQDKGGLVSSSGSKLLLLDWFEQYRQQKLKTGQSAERANSVAKVVTHLKSYAGDGVTLGKVDDKFCKGFIDYLATAKVGRETKNGGKLSGVTANSYFQVFTSALNEAVRKKLIPFNPVQYIGREDKKPIKAERNTRTFLTIEEVKKLMETNCKNQMVKCAFLFSCFTGLRVSDVRNLKWSDIKERDGEKFVCIIIQKTREPLTIKLNKQAESWLPERGQTNEVFDLPFHEATINDNLKRWAKQAGIDKDVCYHMSRHTFATMGLTMGADLYVISKLMGHSEVGITQVYADIINKKREEAVDLMDEAFK